MATKPLSSELIAITEKKMDMTLDDIIKMSKTNAAAKPKSKKQRVSNKSQTFFSGNQYKTQKMRQYTNSRSTLRQAVLAQKRSSFKGKDFPLATEAARKAAVTPFRGGAFNRNKMVNRSKPRHGGSLRLQENLPNGGNRHKAPKVGEALPKSRPKTLDSLFANMKEQRMRSSTSTNNAGMRRGVGARNQIRQPWLRRRFGVY